MTSNLKFIKKNTPKMMRCQRMQMYKKKINTTRSEKEDAVQHE